MAKYSEENWNRIQKHKALQQFDFHKKHNLMTLALALTLGFIAAQRMYLNQPNATAFIILGNLAYIACIFLAPFAPWLIVYPICWQVYIIESEWVCHDVHTKRANDKIKAELIQRYQEMPQDG